MNVPLGALATAGLLGASHAIEPDHVAGISSLTSQYGDSRLSALVGACFSLGHVLLVVAWLAVGYFLLGRTSFPPVLDALGTLVVAGLLGLAGLRMAIRGLRRTHATDEDSADGASAHRPHLPFFGGRGRDARRTATPSRGDIRDYLVLGVVGALFTLSPPASMIAFSATLFPTHGPGAVVAAVAVYAVAITVAMSAVGVGAGTVFDAVETRARTYDALRVVAGVLVTAIAASVLLDATAIPG